MPKILITGNGFDLSFGLPTGYSDFINICKKLQNVQNFNWADLKEDIVALQNSDKLPTSEFPDFDTFKERLNKNTWFRYLSREYGINTWIDFEKHIEKALTIILSIIDEIHSDTFSIRGRYSHSEDVFCKEDFDSNNYEVFLTLMDFEILIHAQFDYFKLNPKYLRSVNNFYVDIAKEKLLESILKELNIFTDLFREYLSIVVLPLIELSNGTIRIDLLKHIDYHFTFNYTPTFSRLISQSIPTIFIHGELEKNNIVLGINDWEQPINDKGSLIPFTKYFQKLNLGIDLKFVNEILSDDVLYQFFFWGHSLDKSDSIYINEVFDKLDSLEKVSTEGQIIVIYHSASSRSSIIKNLLEIRGNQDIMKKQRKGQLIFLDCDSQDLNSELESPMHSREDSFEFSSF